MPNTKSPHTIPMTKSPTGFPLGNTPTSLPITLHPSFIFYLFFVIILETRLIVYSIFAVCANFNDKAFYLFRLVLSLIAYDFTSQPVMKFGVKIIMFAVFFLLHYSP